jgi:uncharacterized membrane-anchored protein YjiN (DUF445 family)
MKPVGDTAASFDQQNSSLLRSPQSSPTRSSVLHPVSASIIDQISSRVTHLEERLNSTDSIYRLAAQGNSVRERERRDRHQSLVEYAKSLEVRLAAAEQQMSQVPKLIKDTVRSEMKRCDNAESIQVMMDESIARLIQRLDDMERYAVHTHKKQSKLIKKFAGAVRLARAQPSGDVRLDDVAVQIDELKRKQTVMLELLNAIRSHEDQDFESVTSQLNGLWAQLSVKRSESPRRMPE